MKAQRRFGLFKWFPVVLLLCLLCQVGSAAAQEYAVVTADVLNLRSTGSSSSAWLGSYTKGTWVTVSGSQNNYYYVTGPDGKQGYMSKNYLQTTSDVTTYSQVAYVNNATSGAFLNFRQTASYSASVIDIFYNGVPLLVKSISDGWVYAQINGVTGYVRSEYVTFSQTVASSTVATIKTPSNSAINLRTGPGTQYGVTTQFAGDHYVMVLAKGTGWWYVSINGYTGFMSSEYLMDGLQSSLDLAADKSTTTGTGSAYAIVSNPLSTQALNVRQYASTAASVLERIYNGTRLTIHSYGSEWCYVTVDSSGTLGYVMTKYITVYNVSTSSTATVYHPSGSYVNLRSSTSMTSSSNILVSIPSGQTVTLLVPGTEWSKVEYNNMTGYMLSYFLK